MAHVKFRQDLFEKGVHILLGLPNGTEATQEMDQGFAQFKPATDKSTVQIAAMKMATRVEARKKMRKSLEVKMAAAALNKSSGSSSLAVLAETAALENNYAANLEEYFSEQGDADGDVDGNEDDFEFEVNGSVCNVKVDNCDLSAIVNGFPGDPIELHPFDRVFTRQNIWSWWCKVGFLPMNRNSLNDDKFRQQFGENAAVGDQGNRL